jgi:hypothetical protein
MKTRLQNTDTEASNYVDWGFNSWTNLLYGAFGNWGHGVTIRQGASGDDRNARTRNDADTEVHFEVETSPADGNDMLIWTIVFNATGGTYYKDGAFWYLQDAQTPITKTAGVVIAIVGTSADTQVDYIRRWRWTSSEPVYYLGTEAASGPVTFSKNVIYPFENELITFTANWTSGNFTEFWWDFSDGGSIEYTADQERNYTYTTAGSYTVNLTAYDDDTASNTSTTETVTVYAELTVVNISITNHLPFLGAASSQNFSYATTGGTPILNNSWAITLPNSSVFNYVNESPLTFTPEIEGEHTVALTVCDLTGGACVSDTDGYKPWNITGGVFLVQGFNVSESCLSEIFLGDSVTFSSGDQSLNWAMDGWTSIGTSASPTFAPPFAYWNDDDYYHFNVSLNTTWGAYTSDGWFTVSAATYTLRAGGCEAGGTGYCWVLGGLYDEATFAEIGDPTTDWDFYSVTSDYYGHTQEESVNATAAELNITWCSNATPLLDHMLVDAMLTYSLENYTTRIYAWDNATFDFSGTCSYANGHQYNFYTVSNATTSSVTFTVTQGGEALEDALLQIQAFHSSTWVTVASQLTDSTGQAQFDIHLCPTFYKFVVQKSGAILYSDKDCAETTSYTIEVGEELDEFFSVWYDISTSCSYDETDEYVACTISDPTGVTVVSTLNVTTALDYSETAVCEVSEASGTTTLVCSVAGEPAGDYAWLLTITTSSGSYKVNTGGFTIYGDIMELEDKGVVAFATILVLLLATRLPPEATILLSVAGFLAIRMMGLITTSYMAVGWVLALGIVGIMRVVKGG